MQITPYTDVYWLVASTLAALMYFGGAALEYFSKREASNRGLYISISTILYFIAMFVVDSIGLQYIGFTVCDYLQNKASSDLASGVWDSAFFPWNVPSLITTISAVGFFVIVITAVTAFKLSSNYYFLKKGE